MYDKYEVFRHVSFSLWAQMLLLQIFLLLLYVYVHVIRSVFNPQFLSASVYPLYADCKYRDCISIFRIHGTLTFFFQNLIDFIP